MSKLSLEQIDFNKNNKMFKKIVKLNLKFNVNILVIFLLLNITTVIAMESNTTSVKSSSNNEVSSQNRLTNEMKNKTEKLNKNYNYNTHNKTNEFDNNSNRIIKYRKYFSNNSILKNLNLNVYILVKNSVNRNNKNYSREKRNTKFDWQIDDAVDVKNNDKKNPKNNKKNNLDVININENKNSNQHENFSESVIPNSNDSSNGTLDNIMKINSYNNKTIKQITSVDNDSEFDVNATDKILSPATITLSAGEYFYNLENLSNEKMIFTVTTEVNNSTENSDTTIDDELIDFLRKHSQQHLEIGKPYESDVKSILWNNGNEITSSNKENSHTTNNIKQNLADHNTTETYPKVTNNNENLNKTKNSDLNNLANETHQVNGAKIHLQIKSEVHNNNTIQKDNLNSTIAVEISGKTQNNSKSDNKTQDEVEYRVESRLDYIHDQIKRVAADIKNSNSNIFKNQTNSNKTIDVEQKLSKDETEVGKSLNNSHDSTTESSAKNIENLITFTKFNDLAHRIAVDEEEIKIAGKNNTKTEEEISTEEPSLVAVHINKNEKETLVEFNNKSANFNNPAHRQSVDEKVKWPISEINITKTKKNLSNENSSNKELSLSENKNITVNESPAKLNNESTDLNNLAHRIAVDEEEYVKPDLNDTKSINNSSQNISEKTSSVSIHIRPTEENSTSILHNVTKREENFDKNHKNEDKSVSNIGHIDIFNNIAHRIAVDAEEYITTTNSNDTKIESPDPVIKLPIKTDLNNKNEKKSTIENLNEAFKQIKNSTANGTASNDNSTTIKECKDIKSNCDSEIKPTDSIQQQQQLIPSYYKLITKSIFKLNKTVNQIASSFKENYINQQLYEKNSSVHHLVRRSNSESEDPKQIYKLHTRVDVDIGKLFVHINTGIRKSHFELTDIFNHVKNNKTNGNGNDDSNRNGDVNRNVVNRNNNGIKGTGNCRNRNSSRTFNTRNPCQNSENSWNYKHNNSVNKRWDLSSQYSGVFGLNKWFGNGNINHNRNNNVNDNKIKNKNGRNVKKNGKQNLHKSGKKNNTNSIINQRTNNKNNKNKFENKNVNSNRKININNDNTHFSN